MKPLVPMPLLQPPLLVDGRDVVWPGARSLHVPYATTTKSSPSTRPCSRPSSRRRAGAAGGQEAKDGVVALRPAALPVGDRARSREERRMADRALNEQVLPRALDGGQRVQPALVAVQPVRHVREVRDAAAAGVQPLF